MKDILDHITEGIAVLLVVLLFHRHRKIDRELSVDQDNTTE